MKMHAAVFARFSLSSMTRAISLNPVSGQMQIRPELIGWMPPPTGIGVRCLSNAMVALTEERQMTQVHILTIDQAKRSFLVCGTDRDGPVLFSRLFSRARLQQLLSEQTP